MAIKQEYAISRAEFDEALVRLRISVSEVSKDTNIPRSYMSEFRNGDRQLRPEHLGKLKDYFESKGIVFEDNPPTPPSDIKTDQPPVQRTVLAIRHLAIDPKLDDDQIEATFEKMAINDAQAEKIFQQKASEGFLSNWNEETENALRDLFGLFATNYILLRHLQGRPLVLQPDDNSQISTISDLFTRLFYQENSHLVSPSIESEILEPEIEEVTE